jgi:salicylate hydroxylase
MPIASLNVLIAGGGIGGLAVAVALSKGGHNVLVLEAADDLKEVGAGLQLSANAVRALRSLGAASAVERAVVTPGFALLKSGISARVLVRVPLGAAGEKRWGAPYWQLPRQVLHDALLNAARASGVGIRTGVRVEGFEQTSDQVKVSLSTSERVTADLLIGADGLHSKVRGQLWPDAKPVFHRQIAARALIPASAWTLPPLTRDAHVWIGPGGHAVAYWIGELLNLVLVRDGEALARGTSIDPDDLRETFSGWATDLRAVLAPLDAANAWPMTDLDPLKKWGSGRVTLLGDAAHPMLPYMAQGAAQALEDAVVLGRALGASDDLPKALRSYEAQRRPRTAMVQGLARRNAKAFHVNLGGANRAVHRIASLATPFSSPAATRSLDAVYGWKG